MIINIRVCPEDILRKNGHHIEKYCALNTTYESGNWNQTPRSIGPLQWPRGLRRRSAAARPLRSWVRIPAGTWMFVCCECCELSGRGLCDKLATRPEESYRLWCVVVCDLETSRMRRPWPALGRSATAKKNVGSTCFRRCFFAHHQEHLTVFTVSGSVHPSCCRLVSRMSFKLVRYTSRQKVGRTLPDTVNTVKCSWWWAKTSPETCRAELE